MEIVQPRWSSWSFLVYAGGLTVLGAAVWTLVYLSGQYGDAAYAGWALVVLVVLAAIALWFRGGEHPVVAGVFAFASVAAFLGFVAAVWVWFGWLPHVGNSSPLSGFHVGRLLLELLTLAAAVVALRSFRFPLLVVWVAGLAWLFVTDLISNGGNWSAVVSIAVGLVLFTVGVALDAGASRPYGFWVHVVAGLTIGGSLIFFWHHGDAYWGLVAVSALVYVWLARLTGRSSWAVLGAGGLLAAAVHFTIVWSRETLPVIGGTGGSPRGWVPPLVFAITGFLLVTLGLRLRRRSP